MVFFKVTDGSQTRRFEAPSDITYNDLKKKLSSVFPDSVKEDSDLVLHYRDSEGDVITLSSDLELQELLNTTQQQTVLKFYLPRNNSTTGNTPHHHSWSFPASSLADRLEKELEEFASLFNVLSTPSGSSSSGPSKESSSAEEGNTSPDANSAESAPKEAADEEVRSKPSEGGDEKKESTSSQPTSHNNGSNTQGCTVGGGLFPLLLSDLFFHPPSPKRVDYQLRLTPYGVICHC